MGSIILDNNGLQIDGKIEEVAGLTNIEGKFSNFGLKVINVDGHNIPNLIDAFDTAKQTKGVPTIIIAKTIKGKGVSFMEGKAEWHGKAPKQEEYEKAIEELRCGYSRTKHVWNCCRTVNIWKDTICKHIRNVCSR